MITEVSVDQTCTKQLVANAETGVKFRLNPLETNLFIVVTVLGKVMIPGRADPGEEILTEEILTEEIPEEEILEEEIPEDQILETRECMK